MVGLFQSLRSIFGREQRDYANLSRFARKNGNFLAAVRVVAPACETKHAGEALLQEINRVIAERDYAGLTALLDRLRLFLDPDQSPETKKFWAALIADCRVITENRLRRGKISSLWGVTPIVNMSAGVAADRALDVDAHSLVFTTYHTSSNFDFVFSEIQARLVTERGQDWILFRWLMLVWAIANFDIFHLYNDCGIVEPAGGYWKFPLWNCGAGDGDISSGRETSLYVRVRCRSQNPPKDLGSREMEFLLRMSRSRRFIAFATMLAAPAC